MYAGVLSLGLRYNSQGKRGEKPTPNSKKELLKRPRSRPRTHPMPDPIPDTPENVARILMNTTPKREGDRQYLKDAPPTSPYRRRK